MPGKKKERVYNAGGADPRTGQERLAGVINRAFNNPNKQTRSWDDSPETTARNKRAVAKRTSKKKKK